ncbi:NrtA/SsuA/CpmA family ABC transporter substrate-binding protein [uncultured Draconibacterium sp.]|uniref:ABC transporter substrate-binding protein n=1 Tax=uncultured Draconibacterium sp. TaxID=1573823 RepID=UPI0029C8A3CE|nr:NrtA/SsuA/CpmA family ABC transporter substrate-binding protein [uncultured Draconibacterium sp.]
MNKKVVIITVLILAFVIAVIGLLKTGNKADVPVQYAYIPTALIDAPSAVSEDTLSKSGISIKPFSTGIETVQALIGDAADIATLAEWPFLLASLKREDLRIVAMISTAKSMGMVANKDKGIEKTSDLEGKTIGFPQGTSAQFVYETLINSSNLNGKVKGVNLAPPNLQPSLVRGDIDAIVVWQPFLEKAIQQNPEKFHLLPGSDEVLNVVYFVVTTQEYINNNPDGIKKVLNILIDADNKLAANDPETLRRLSNKTNIDIETLYKLTPLFKFEVTIDSTITNTFERLSLWAVSSGLADETVLQRNWNQYIYSDILKEIAPDNVKL